MIKNKLTIFTQKYSKKDLEFCDETLLKVISIYSRLRQSLVEHLSSEKIELSSVNRWG